MDLRDWFIIGVVAAALVAGTAYIFIHVSVEAFVAWCGFAPSIVGLYHWFVLRDSKIPDAS